MVHRLLLAGVIVSASAGVLAQEPASTQMVQVDPIRCWWRTSAGAVRIGETFSIGLTCAVLEAEDVQVIPDEAGLRESVIQLAPFEVVGGSHPPDLRSGQRRFFQYEYVARVISPDVIGRDVPLPNLVIHYRINSRVPGNAAQQGRDFSYLLPAHTVRVVSLVPASATDIRDMSGEDFARVEDLGVRAGILEIAAVTFVALGSLMTIVALVGLARGTRKGPKTDQLALSEWAALGLADRDLIAVRRESEQQGWSQALAGRALAATRVAAACALGRPVTHTKMPANTEGAIGKLAAWWPSLLGAAGRARRVRVSSTVTSLDVAREVDRLPLATPPARRQILENLAAAMATLTAAQFGQSQELDRAPLDAALAAASSAIRRLRTESIWPRPHIRRWTSRSPELEQQT